MTEQEGNLVQDVADMLHAYNKGRSSYDIFFEIDCDCEELLDAIGLEYQQCKDDDTQNEVLISLTPAEYKESIYNLALGSCNEQTIASYILNPELSEYTTKVTIYTPSGDKVCFS